MLRFLTPCARHFKRTIAPVDPDWDGFRLPRGDVRFSVHGRAFTPTIPLEQLLKRLNLGIHLVSRRNLDDADFSRIVVAYRNLVLEQSGAPKKARSTSGV